ncbi:MAG: hypothetical protein JNM93_11085 [Bacteriovoracaceae bacterium]|nr:hypothetical protein [Bacteriovoracaceae bacterium]
MSVGQREQYFFGHGKLLLSGEYFVLDGAHALALPTRLGQSLTVRYRKTFAPKLIWKSFDVEGHKWFEAEMELWQFNSINQETNETLEVLRKILQEARVLNPHFLREEVEVTVETKLDFPVDWGLGSSSSLIYNIAQWAYVSPFELAFRTLGGSGYDIACAQSLGPIMYQKKVEGPSWRQVNFNPAFASSIYFVSLGKKAYTSEALAYYKKAEIKDKERIINIISHLTDEIITAQTLGEFESLLLTHEKCVSDALQLQRMQDLYFSDYWGVVKSLGAWGGDFVLVTSDRGQAETASYFREKGFSNLIPYADLIGNYMTKPSPFYLPNSISNETLLQ